jgi:hypothetical protein
VVRYRCVAVAVAVAGVCGALAPGAWTAPSTPRTLIYELTGCELPDGTPIGSLTGVKQPSEAAALHLRSGDRFIFMWAAPEATPNDPLFETRGFDHNDIALVQCHLVQPVTGERLIVRGLITPGPGERKNL